MSTDQHLTWEEARALAFKIARAQRLDYEDAEDVAQEVCLSLTSYSKPFGSGLVAVRTYARIANWAKHEDARKRGEGAFLYDAVFPALSPEEAVDVRTALASITPKQQEVVREYVLEQRTLREIARARGLVVNGVFELLNRGLGALARRLGA